MIQHDWFYHMSDDPSVYRAGSTEADRIRTIANLTPDHMELHNAYAAYTRGERDVPVLLFWHHPESDDTFITTDEKGIEQVIVNMCDEVSEVTWYEMRRA
jgi:hypothetical protein